MPLDQRKTFINHRRRVRTDHILFSNSTTIYPCQSYISKNVAYNINPNISEKYAEYIRYKYIYKLAFNINKFDRALHKQKKLHNQFLVSETKSIRFRKLLHVNREELRKFNSREDRNIEELKN